MRRDILPRLGCSRWHERCLIEGMAARTVARRLRQIWPLFKETGEDFVEDNVTRLAAALAYYTILSLAPLVVLALAMAGLAFDQEATRGRLAAELGAVVGSSGAEAVEAIVESAKTPSTGIVSSVIGVVVLLFGASGVFGELQGALNTIWEVAPKPGRGIWGTVRDRLFSFAMVMGVAFLLLVSLILSAALSAVGAFLERSLPGGEAIWQVTNFVLSFAVVSALFAVTFKVVPDVEIRWRDVWIGALVTAFLFTIGKLLIGLYLGKSSVASSYGAAGSLVVLVIWVYYSSVILFLGAEFTQVFARRFGSRIRPSDKAVPLTDEARGRMGLQPKHETPSTT
jgi:membrane protein